MDLFELALGFSAIWVGFNFVLNPLVRRWVRSDSLSETGLAVAAAIETGAMITFWLMLSSWIALGVVAYLTRIVPSDAAEAERALEYVRTASEVVSSVTEGWGLVASCVALFALLLWAYRRFRDAQTADFSPGHHRTSPRPFSRILTVFASEGMLTTLSTGLKVLFILLLLLTVPASLVVTGPAVANLLAEKTDELTENLRNFRLVAEISDVQKEFETVVADDIAGVAIEPGRDDEEIANGLARLFESEIAPGSWVPAAPRLTVQAAMRVEANAVRDAILGAHAERSSAVELGRPPSTGEGSFANEADSLLKKSSQTRGVSTTVGHRVRNEFLRLAREHRKVWAQLRSSYQSYVSSFGRMAPPQQIRGLAISQWVGDAFTAVTGAGDDFFAQQIRTLGGSMSADAAEAYLQATYRRFVVEAAKGGDLAAAISKATHISEYAAPPVQAAALKQIAELTPTNAELAEMAPARRATLSVLEGNPDRQRITAALQRFVATTNGRPSLHFADAFASYEDYLPGTPGNEQSTRRATIARELKLTGAPPLPGTETRSYARLSQKMAGRAGSYRALRGFSRIGGVLIGREPEGENSISVHRFEWRVEGSDFSFDIQAESGPVGHFGPYNAAIANLALAYAADGRPTAVTMVSASPLSDLKILTHPILVDTGLGCRARRLDQFVDGTDEEDLRVTRFDEDSSARGEIALYTIARAARILTYFQRPAISLTVEKNEAEAFLAQARSDLADRELKERATVSLEDEQPLRISAKPEFFDRELVGQIAGCRRPENVEWDAFLGCLHAQFASESGSVPGDKSFDWLAPAPQYEIWSGVREQSYEVSADFGFLSAPKGDALWPFSFMVQVAIQSPAYFVGSPSPWFSEDNTKVEEYVDLDPWEFPRTAKVLPRAIAKAIEGDPERASVLKDMQEFAILQRFFRAALDGRLGTDFPLDELVRIDAKTANSVNRSTPTLRWHVKPGMIEVTLLKELKKAVSSPGIDECRILIEDMLAAGNGRALAAIGQTEWEDVCGSAALQDARISGLAEAAAAARNLRASLDVAVDEAPTYALNHTGCPPP